MTYPQPHEPYQPYQQAPPPGAGYPAPGTWPQPPVPGSYVPGGPVPGQRPRRKRRVFLWIFVALQVLFVILLVAGVAGTHNAPSHAQVVSACYHNNWWPLYKSQADCVVHYSKALTDAGDLGEGLGVAVLVIGWFVVDVILGISYGIYKLATRGR